MIADRRFLLIDGQKIALDTKELPMDVQLIRDLTPLATLKQLEKLLNY